jgi:hypothetical protein
MLHAVFTQRFFLAVFVMAGLWQGRGGGFFIDDDPSMAAAQGVIGLQIEGTGKVSFRNLCLKRLS